MAEEKQGTGKHPHKSTEEPYPHHESGSQKGGQTQHSKGSQESGRSHESGRSNQGESSDDLKEREYRDSQGNVHHHTRTYEEQHKK
jgi:hypothetical protein